MLARLQQFTTFALLAAATAWAAVHGSRGQFLLAVIGTLLILLGYTVVLAFEFALMLMANRHDELPPAKLGDIVSAWWGEVRSAPQVFCWEQPFRSRAVPDLLTGRPGQRGLVMVHGFVCNRGLWNHWIPRLTPLGIPHVAVSMEPVFGDIEAYAPQIEAAVAALRASTGLPPVVVAHSMGGLAVRVWLRSRGRSGSSSSGNSDAASIAAVHHVVTLGTPHRGTALAKLAFSSNTRQMVCRSDWLDELAATESAALHARITCVYSNCDNIVFPTSCATLPQARARALKACAHVHMVFHEEAFEEVLGHLKNEAVSLPVQA